jgi:hypothetical protein
MRTRIGKIAESLHIQRGPRLMTCEERRGARDGMLRAD